MLPNTKSTINAQNAKGHTALMLAVHNSFVDTVKLLIKQGVDVNVQSTRGNSALMIASNNPSTKHNRKIIKLLINAGADVNLQNINGMTALMLAVMWSGSVTNTQSNIQSNTRSIIKILCRANCKVDLQNGIGYTALMMAATTPCPDMKIIKQLITTGANIYCRDADNCTIFDFVNQSVRLKIVKIYDKHQAKCYRKQAQLAMLWNYYPEKIDK